MATASRIALDRRLVAHRQLARHLHALSRPGSSQVLGKVAAIDILELQLITTSLLVAE